MRVFLFMVVLVAVACSSPEKVTAPAEKKKPTKEEMCRDKETSEIYKLFCE